MSEIKINRRNLLAGSLKAIGAVGAISVGSKIAQAQQACSGTQQQPEGPFYPVNSQADKDMDLTRVAGNPATALGEVIKLKGVVKDQQCNPVEGALVDIWQACASGKYNHPGDPNDAPLDPNFQYWGQVFTNELGQYSFLTIKPGAYPASNTWVRPPHIHMKVSLRGFAELTTQVYFSDEVDLNSTDRILQNLPSAERDHVTVELALDESVAELRRAGEFNPTLRRL